MSSNKLYSKEVTYPDGFAVAGSVKDIKCYWEHPKFICYIFRLLFKSIEIPSHKN